MLRFALNGPRSQLLCYAAVGALVNGAGYLASLVLTWAGLSPHCAVIVLLPVSLWAAFQLHGRVTFAGIGCGRTTGLRILTVMLTAYALSILLHAILVARSWWMVPECQDCPSHGDKGLFAATSGDGVHALRRRLRSAAGRKVSGAQNTASQQRRE